MTKKLVQHGNSSALIIDKPILDLLKIDQDTQLEITTDGIQLIIRPVIPKKGSKKISASLEKVNKKFGKTLKRLAE
ncbi:MAG TPA: AbrB/MazE/SpoVT family DNA-binding domain-containing protein [Leptospiraceae bacterium]|nr:AbrB/MazE/SpoVT family DNA-binding domain-containing protein [Leptospiraceae bacterium]